ncbi:hypothetical protein NX722_17260 [Endozoicomonas gorgoniicola]|uniref:Uncharacterized protein n=1 Tax=Endozoicomonas gorgoniicola TaxID=1234144 RepID=A0ABT3MY80_9GAMM|nr:hypothetical protein [Endozoicomonas gorgoniicola]MCW7554336.1 hypothetical protein [Endozoicomonas gorgoniicola]
MKKTALNLIVTLGLLSQPAFATAPAEDENSHDFYILDHLKTGVAWGLVPLSSEVAINTLQSYLENHKLSFLLKLLAIHKSNIRRASSQHLTDNISALLESVSYKALSDDHVRQKTDALQTDLRYRSLSTFSVLSLHAQKARKTFYRLLDIIDTVSSSASLAMSRGDENRAAALMALNALSMTYLHPEATGRDVLDSVYVSFSKNIDWDKHPDFRTRITQHLSAMDPLLKHSAMMSLRYCNMLNEWKVSSAECLQYEAATMDELKGLASATNLEETELVKSLLKNIPKDQIRSSIFILGVTLPATFLYFLGKRHFAINVIAKHFSKIVGAATSKQNMERFASQSRRTLENWGAINTGSTINRKSGGVDYTNQYFSSLQKKAGTILAEQPNFARSNSQRTLETLVIHFADAYRNTDKKASILASAMIQNHREIVEINTEDTVVKGALMAYLPIKDESELNEIYKRIETLDPHGLKDPIFYKGYKKLAGSWAEVTLNDTLSSVFHPQTVNEQTGTCPAEGCPPEKTAEPEKTDKPENVSPWYYHYLPDKETVTIGAIHGTALGYSMATALIAPYTINKFKPEKGKPRRLPKIASYYFLSSLIEFGLLSVGEPAIVQLQTAIKNWIGSKTGIIDPEDREIQNELTGKINVINQKLSIEAQTSRSYKMTMEAMLTKCLSLAGALLINEEKSYTDSARVVAYAAYLIRYYHPEFETDSTVITALANARLGSGLNLLQQNNLMPLFAKQVLLHLAELDSNYADKAIKTNYLNILNNWGIECNQDDARDAQDVLDSWAVYGDYALGATGFMVQSVVKAFFHKWGVVPRSIANFLANTFEFGTTDSLRKRIYAYSRQAMLNVATSYSPDEKKSADYANNELTKSFRRQKFYFTKPELDARTQLVQIITSVIHCFSEAFFLMVANNTDKATDHIASGLSRVILYAPDLSGDDVHLKKALQTLTARYRDKLNGLNEEILRKTSEQLKTKVPEDSDIYSSGMAKAQLMQQAWSNVMED